MLVFSGVLVRNAIRYVVVCWTTYLELCHIRGSGVVTVTPVIHVVP
jgi:hypothetical protein